MDRFSGPITRRRQKTLDAILKRRSDVIGTGLFLGTFSAQRQQGLFRSGKRGSHTIAHTKLGWLANRQRVMAAGARNAMQVPNHMNVMIDEGNNVYNVGYSKDGQYFYQSSQDFTTKLYKCGAFGTVRPWRRIMSGTGYWTVTDTDMSGDNRMVANSTLGPCVELTGLVDGTESVRVDVSPNEDDDWEAIGLTTVVWSVRFSPDADAFAVGTNARRVAVYDIETKKCTASSSVHRGDVNSVCYVDASPFVLCSASDDTSVCIHDTRVDGVNGITVGALSGHTEGLTHVEAKGDGRLLLTNGKDQTMKLWDIRTMATGTQIPSRLSLPRTGFDYRFEQYPDNPKQVRAQTDQSILTCVGHSVGTTLIRCCFSPALYTGQQYLCTGSDQGTVYMYDLEGTIVSLMDVSSRIANLRSDVEYGAVVRDIAWHPNLPILTATYWNEMETGVVRLDVNPYHLSDSVYFDAETQSREGHRVSLTRIDAAADGGSENDSDDSDYDPRTRNYPSVNVLNTSDNERLYYF